MTYFALTECLPVGKSFLIALPPAWELAGTVRDHFLINNQIFVQFDNCTYIENVTAGVHTLGLATSPKEMKEVASGVHAMPDGVLMALHLMSHITPLIGDSRWLREMPPTPHPSPLGEGLPAPGPREVGIESIMPIGLSYLIALPPAWELVGTVTGYLQAGGQLFVVFNEAAYVETVSRGVHTLGLATSAKEMQEIATGVHPIPDGTAMALHLMSHITPMKGKSRWLRRMVDQSTILKANQQ